MTSGIRFERVPWADVPWDELDRFADRTVFQTRAWLGFLAASQGAEPVVARVVDGSGPIGWFTGGRVRRFGLGVLGSPLAGWTTSYQGFNLADGTGAADLLPALARFASAELGCRHVEVMDRRLAPADITAPGWHTTVLPGWEIDLRRTTDDLLASTSTSCRWGIRKAARNGLVVREARPDGFASTFHVLLREVFARRGSSVTYSEGRVQALVDHLGGTADLLLLTVHQGDGPAVAAGVFPGRTVPAGPDPGTSTRGTASYWGGAATTESLRLLPYEAMLWAAITRWQDRGATTFDLGGGGPFKAKFGGTPIEVAWARHSDPPVLERLRGAAAAVARRRVR